MPDETSLETQLRDLLSDPRWSLHSWPDAPQRIRRTARRQRIKAISAGACTGAIAAVACAVPLAVLGGSHGMPRPGTHPATPSVSPSRAADKLMLPDVVGLAQQQAEMVIQNAGFTVQIVYVANGSAPPGVVVAQTPIAGTRVAPGSLITLEVASSPASPPAGAGS